MKRSTVKRRQGMAFTLVELLVVIAIIAILAGVIVASVGSAIKFAKRTKSAATAVQLQTAVQNYYTEYGVYPVQAGYGDGSPAKDAYYDGTVASQGAWENLIWALCGNINPANTATAVTPTVPNTRAIAFLTPARADLDANGIPVNPFGALGGNVGSTYYSMVLDSDYSGVAGDTGSALGLVPNFSAATNVTFPANGGIAGGVIVWCPNDQPTSGSYSRSAFWAHTY